MIRNCTGLSTNTLVIHCTVICYGPRQMLSQFYIAWPMCQHYATKQHITTWKQRNIIYDTTKHSALHKLMMSLVTNVTLRHITAELNQSHWISSFSSVLFFASFFCCLSSCTRKRQFLSKALVYYCFLVFRTSHWWVHFPVTVLYSCRRKCCTINANAPWKTTTENIDALNNQNELS